MFINIFNLEIIKNFIFIKFKKIKKNIRLYLKNEGCKNYKYLFYKSKKIKPNDFLIIKNKKSILINILFIKYLNQIYIKLKNNSLNIKNLNIKNLCNCRFSFKI
ncbi:Iron-sulfur cluster insertion protein [Candidatus Nasuia deltocephalinicola str. NAS-ALF]|uniref:Iron-sulfur cluster insertion protein n=1 Tax=Candidatus Nasuia deltocephalinicola str. NAS-ALF TaxID=1343077 RepID=S5TF23_9PROT|nr:Iron-sulfur cluster insertion protein [Candidatus Nasuia deltocephalinicola str. NAS-ALF]